MKNNTTKHTPGPWEIDTETFYGEPIAHHIGAKGELIATIEREENARLIASAPSLLSALQAIATESEGDKTDMELLEFRWWVQDIALAAIAKATGEDVA